MHFSHDILSSSSRPYYSVPRCSPVTASQWHVLHKALATPHITFRHLIINCNRILSLALPQHHPGPPTGSGKLGQSACSVKLSRRGQNNGGFNNNRKHHYICTCHLLTAIYNCKKKTTVNSNV